MPGSFAPSLADLLRVLPELVLITFGTLIMVLEPLTANHNKRRLGYLSFAALTLALGMVAANGSESPVFRYAERVSLPTDNRRRAQHFLLRLTSHGMSLRLGRALKQP